MAKYTAKPVEVEAFKINHVSHHLIGHHVITMENLEVRKLPFAETFRYAPKVGDYLVRTSVPNVYEYINPAEVFDAKYELSGESDSVVPVAPEVGLIGTAKSPAEPKVEILPDGSVKTTVGTHVTIVPPVVDNTAGLASSPVPEGVSAGLADNAVASVSNTDTGANGLSADVPAEIAAVQADDSVSGQHDGLTSAAPFVGESVEDDILN